MTWAVTLNARAVRRNIAHQTALSSVSLRRRGGRLLGIPSPARYRVEFPEGPARNVTGQPVQLMESGDVSLRSKPGRARAQPGR